MLCKTDANVPHYLIFLDVMISKIRPLRPPSGFIQRSNAEHWLNWQTAYYKNMGETIGLYAVFERVFGCMGTSHTNGHQHYFT